MELVSRRTSPGFTRRLACFAALLGVASLATDGRGADGGAPGENRELPPAQSDELTERAAALFDAVVHDDPSRAEPFFFPREPFLSLKDVADPAKYYAELLRAYRSDVHRLHARRRSWEGATFSRFELGSRPRFVAPGEEWNKIGYHRTFDAKIRYEISGKSRELVVRTIISWAGRWYVTHLLPIERPRPPR